MSPKIISFPEKDHVYRLQTSYIKPMAVLIPLGIFVFIGAVLLTGFIIMPSSEYFNVLPVSLVMILIPVFLIYLFYRKYSHYQYLLVDDKTIKLINPLNKKNEISANRKDIKFQFLRFENFDPETGITDYYGPAIKIEADNLNIYIKTRKNDLKWKAETKTLLNLNMAFSLYLNEWLALMKDLGVYDYLGVD